MKKNYDKTDEYYLFIFNKILDIAPIIGLSAGFVLTISRLFGLLSFVDFKYVIFFDIICASYFLIAYNIRRYGILRNGKVDKKALETVGFWIDILIILQWNLISYIFPVKSFWGFAPMFVLISAFLFSTKIVLFEIIGISISIATSWIIMGDKLLPDYNNQFAENLILRIVALIISFIVIYILTSNAESFTTVTKENFKSIEAKNNELETMGRDIIDFTADIIEERDSSSGLHVKRLKSYTRIIAEQMRVLYPEYGLTDEIIEYISFACVLHDVGKIGIPDSILLKPSKLTKEEFELVKTHTDLGSKIIDKLPDSIGIDYKHYCKEICQFHHEKYDGCGYPAGLVGDDIPISAQIVSVVDCYDALTSERPYKSALPGQVAVKMILDGECGAFSEKILTCLIKCKDILINI